MVNVPNNVLKNDDQRKSTADVSGNGEGGQGTKVPDEGQKDYGKKQNCHPRLGIKSVGDLERGDRLI